MYSQFIAQWGDPEKWSSFQNDPIYSLWVIGQAGIPAQYQTFGDAGH